MIAKRGRFAWLMSAVMLGAYLVFILLIAFEPAILGILLGADSIYVQRATANSIL